MNNDTWQISVCESKHWLGPVSIMNLNSATEFSQSCTNWSRWFMTKWHLCTLPEEVDEETTDKLHPCVYCHILHVEGKCHDFVRLFFCSANLLSVWYHTVRQDEAGFSRIHSDSTCATLGWFWCRAELNKNQPTCNKNQKSVFIWINVQM